MPIQSTLAGRHIIITGGTGALGSAVVSWMLDRGGICHVPCIREEELTRFPFTKHDRVKITLGVELTDEPSVERFFAGVGPKLWAGIHIAGGFAYGAVESVKKQDFVFQMQSNALTCFLCCREAVKVMGGRASGGAGGGVDRGGRIVNVAARPALEPRTGANMVPYTAAKAAVAALTQALAEEVVARGILVNAVVPSIMDTPANRAAMPEADHAKWAKVEDVAATIGFLASPENTCTRGGLVPVYGAA
jgi:NAD(P)-dependent dehydrogenase (short-subunit alcohol dehydrogenase family)